MAKKDSRSDIKVKPAAPKISSLQISDPVPIADPPVVAASTFNDKMVDIIEGYEDGMMFVCTKETFDECMSLRLLGLPFAQMKVVKALQPEKSALFLFNMSDRRLHGLFHASSAGGANINRDAWNKGSSNSSPFPAQIEFVIARDCEPIHEKEFKHVFPDKHRIRKLDKSEVQKLVRLFLRDTKPTATPAGGIKRTVTVPPVANSSDKTIPRPAITVPPKKEVPLTAPKVEPSRLVAEKKSEPTSKPAAFQWAAAPPKFAWGSKKLEEPVPVVTEPLPAQGVVEKSALATSSTESSSSVATEPNSDVFSEKVQKPAWSEDDLWGPMEPDSKMSSAATVVKQAQQQAQSKPHTPVLTQPIQPAQLTKQSSNPSTISQHLPQSFLPQAVQPSQPQAYLGGASPNFPNKLHTQASLFPSVLFPPQSHEAPPPLQMHFDGAHAWGGASQDGWKEASVWGATSAASVNESGWNSWGRAFDSAPNLLFGNSVASHLEQGGGEELVSFETEEYEEELPHGPKCACCACMPQLPSNLGSLLDHVGLSDCYANFAAEQMDIEALSMCDDTHLHEMNFVVGARVKLGALIRQLQKRHDLGG